MSRSFLQQVENVRSSRLLSLSRKNNRKPLQIENSPPPTKSAGLYWIYTSYDLDDLQNCDACSDVGAIDIAPLVTFHKGLHNICTIEQEGFTLVYNGMAGSSCGLRGRIHQHFNGGKGTGCLSINKRLSINDLSRWRVSYVTLETNGETTPDVPTSSHHHAQHLERIWRLEYGWPLLCKI